MAKRSWAKGAVRSPVTEEAAAVLTASDRGSVAWRKHAVALLIPFALTLLAYANSFSGGLLYDSRVSILEDAKVHTATAANIRTLVTQDLWSTTSTSWLYRPLTKLSYLFNYAILGNGPRPAGYHAVNLILHGINIVLLYLCGLMLFDHLENAQFLALATASIWAVHPVLTEAVTNIVGRADLFAGIAVLGGLYCHMRAPLTWSRRRAAWMAALALLVAVGIFSKENAIVVLAVMAIYDAAYRPRSWRQYLSSYLTALLPLGVYFACRYHVLSPLIERLGDYGDNPLIGADFVTARLTAMAVLGRYLGLFVWPASLSCDYSYNQIPVAANWMSFVALAAYLGIAAAAILFYQRRREIFFLAAFFLVTLAPVANIFLLIGTIMGERFLYLPAIAFAGCLVIAIQAAAGPRAAPVILAAICLAFAGRTFARNFDWHDELSLWRSAERVSPGSYRVHHSVAYWLMAQTHPNDAEIRSEVEKTVSILDTLPPLWAEVDPYINAAAWYRRRSDAPKALALLQRAEAIDEAQTAGLIRLNRAHGKITVGTGNAVLRAELGRTYAALGNTSKALDELKQARTIKPDAAYTEEIAKTYRDGGDWRGAAVALMEGLWLDPNQTGFASELMDLYRSSDPHGCAVAGNSINMNCPAVREQFCDAARDVMQFHTAARRPLDAAKVRESAVREFGCR